MQTNVIRAASAFIWLVVEGAGSRSLRDAAVALYPEEIVTAAPFDRLRYMLFAAAAVLCNSASRSPGNGPSSPPAVDGLTTAQVMRLAQRLVGAIQRASRKELASAHAYFLAPPWRHVLAEGRPFLAVLSVALVRFMIECAWESVAARAEGAKALELRMSNDVHLKPPGDPAAGILRRR